MPMNPRHTDCFSKKKKAKRNKDEKKTKKKRKAVQIPPFPFPLARENRGEPNVGYKKVRSGAKKAGEEENKHTQPAE